MMKEKIIRLLKQETVLCAALFLAAISMLLVAPDAEYITYLDFRTLAILFCLMGIVAGLQKTGLFRWIAQALLSRVKRARQLVLILVLLCFFSSMLLTNDVALITFVPFTFTVLNMIGPQAKKQLIIPIVVLQTIAANLGSMLTPIGNPQNLYLYGKAGISLGSFVLLMLPYTSAALAALILWSLKQSRTYPAAIAVFFTEKEALSKKKASLAAYSFLFVLNLLTVARMVPCALSFTVTVIALAVMDKGIFLRIDYSLLLTFAGFFIFIGNMQRLPAFSRLLQQTVAGHEMAAGIIISQIISNVPAALLLSGFTDRLAPLIIGVNLGGLGTLIASMASLISYKLIAREERAIKGAYFRYFTAANFGFLAVLLVFSLFCGI
ncbi:MAG: citrate transporter [Provencibacterium sp.]|jgi:Na+/H+ antiporter NhaD/arsenite permease-like protein|nr:citrate transporter [Provencibacterium sp.]